VILDRDGTINEKAREGGYVTTPPAFRFLPGAEDAIRLLRSAYGVPVLAHPARIPALAERVLPSLVAAGLQGLECYYGQYDDATVERLVELANQRGGSDNCTVAAVHCT